MWSVNSTGYVHVACGFVLPYFLLSALLWHTIERKERRFLFFLSPSIVVNAVSSIAVGGTLWNTYQHNTTHKSPEWHTDPRYLPFPVLLMMLVSLAIVSDMHFYLTHRWCHRSVFLWKHIHRHHHVWREPFGVMGIESHPIEHVVVNVGSVVIPILIVQPPLWLVDLILMLAAYKAVTSHSTPLQNWIQQTIQRKVAWVRSGEHIEHHRTVHRYFGTLGLMDWFFGTGIYNV